MKNKKEKNIDSSNITVNDLIAFIVTNDVANFDFTKNEIKKLKAKYRFMSLAVVIYILYKEKILHKMAKNIEEEVKNH